MTHDLDRFLVAQEGSWASILAELRAGRKTGHWIWFVFPQLVGLGSSSTSRYYAIGSLDEARAYLAHPVLGARLRDAAEALLTVDGRTAEQILGPLDALKVCSSMTLFRRADPSEGLFSTLLDRFFAGREDPRTLELLERPGLLAKSSVGKPERG